MPRDTGRIGAREVTLVLVGNIARICTAWTASVLAFLFFDGATHGPERDTTRTRAAAFALHALAVALAGLSASMSRSHAHTSWRRLVAFVAAVALYVLVHVLWRDVRVEHGGAGAMSARAAAGAIVSIAVAVLAMLWLVSVPAWHRWGAPASVLLVAAVLLDALALRPVWGSTSDALAYAKHSAHASALCAAARVTSASLVYFAWDVVSNELMVPRDGGGGPDCVKTHAAGWLYAPLLAFALFSGLWQFNVAASALVFALTSRRTVLSFTLSVLTYVSTKIEQSTLDVE